MPDDRLGLRKRLGDLDLASWREEEIIRELSDHLFDHASALEENGMPSETAAREALDSVSNWAGLGDAIREAETEDTIMNYRTRALWLPSLGALTLSNVLLAFFQHFGPPPRFHWLGSGKSMEPYLIFFVPWLVSQPVVGGIAAYWSRRAGGTLRHQLLAALAPAIALLGVFLVVLPFAIVLDEGVRHHIQLSAFLALTLIWVLLPSLPLLLGAAPFLRRPQTQE